MTRDESIIAEEGGPSLDEVWKGNRLLHLGAAEVAAYIEGEAPLRCMLEEAFLKRASVIHGEFGMALEEVGEASEGIGWRRWGRSC